MSIDHYENFPVASVLLPAHLRPAVRDIYRFARSADDIADEGHALPEHRLRDLEAYRNALHDIAETGLSDGHDPDIRAVFEPLARTIRQHDLPMRPFLDLLSAFEQDVRQSRYDSDVELLDYCRRSADPVGRLMLHLYKIDRPETLQWADAICTGLQLTNFWQDVAIDWEKDRVYLPQEKLRSHGVDENYIAANINRDTPLPFHQPWHDLMQGQVAQARDYLLQGRPLCRALPGRIGFELRLVILGGLRILERLDELHYDIFHRRPTLRRLDWANMLWQALLQRP